MSYFSEVKIVDKVTGEAAQVNDSGQLKVVLDGKVCEENSTIVPLLAAEVYTGTAQEILDYGIIFISVYSDVASATDGLQLQQSIDGTNWDHVDRYTIAAGSGKTFSIQPACKYMRVVYTNDAVDQTEFRLCTVLKKTNSLASSHRISDDIIDDDDAELVIGVIKGRDPSGTYVDFSPTMSGNFKMSIEELEDDVSVNSNQQLKITQFDSDGVEAPIGTNTDPNHTLNVGAQWQTGNDGIDRGTNTPVGITLEHNMVHRGKHFTLADYALNQEASTTHDFAVTTPAGLNRVHMLFGLSATDGATFEIYEDCTDLTEGAEETPVNNNRSSAEVSALTIVSNPETITLGTRIEGFLIGGGGTSGVVSRDQELVLKPDSVYLFRITSLADNNDIGWEAYWYEHETQNMV